MGWIIIYSYFMPVCSIVKLLPLGTVDDLMHYCTRPSAYGGYISQLIRFTRASSYVSDFNTNNKLLTQKLLIQGYRYHKLRKTFSKFYRRYFDLISKFQVRLKSLLRRGLSEPDFYGDLVYKLKKIVGSNNFSLK